MTDTSSLSHLIDLLERCAGPDRELDLSIHIALNPGGDVARVTAAHPRGLNSRDGLAWELSTNCVLYENWSNNRCWSNGGYPVPAVTESIDAAMTLVPDGMEKDFTDLYGIARVSVGINANPGPFYGTHEGGSLAIALCIAALKAQLSTRTNHQEAYEDCGRACNIIDGKIVQQRRQKEGFRDG